MRPSRRLLRFAALLLVPALHAQTPSPAPASSVASDSARSHLQRMCQVSKGVPLPGDTLLSADDNAGAEKSFRDLLTTQPGSEDAHLGLVRALIGQDRTAEARTEADGMLRAHPKSAIAEVALSEVDYRAGDPDAAFKHARQAIDDDPCEGRADGAMASLLELNGYYAREAGFLNQAHQLRPNDELIRRAWIGSLPRKRRQEEISRYLDGEHHLSDDETRGYNNSLSVLKAHHAGDCRVTSKAETTELPFQPIYADHSYPIAFGLDVSLNNTKRRMQIDSGASGIILSPGAARALKLEHEYTFKTEGVGDEGAVESYLAHVEKIRIGDIELTNCMVEVMGKSRLDVDGLIGPDVFGRWLVTLDYGNAKARLEPLPPRPGTAPGDAAPKAAEDSDSSTDEVGYKDRYIAPEMKDWGRILRVGHNILLPAYLKDPGSSHYLIMDTGASQTVLSSTMGREIGKLHGSAMQFRGVSGKVNKVFETDSAPLTVANLRLAPVGYYAYDITNLSHNLGFETSGLLGLPTLQRLTIHIDYRDNLIKLDYDPKHDIQRF